MADEIVYSVSDQDGIKLIKLVGNISNSTYNHFEELVDDFSKKFNIIIDMKEVNIITSSGLNSLINISRIAYKRKSKVVLIGLRDRFINMFDVMDVSHYYLFVDNIEEAMTKLNYSKT